MILRKSAKKLPYQPYHISIFVALKIVAFDANANYTVGIFPYFSNFDFQFTALWVSRSYFRLKFSRKEATRTHDIRSHNNNFLPTIQITLFAQHSVAIIVCFRVVHSSSFRLLSSKRPTIPFTPRHFMPLNVCRKTNRKQFMNYKIETIENHELASCQLHIDSMIL